MMIWNLDDESCAFTAGMEAQVIRAFDGSWNAWIHGVDSTRHGVAVANMQDGIDWCNANMREEGEHGHLQDNLELGGGF